MAAVRVLVTAVAGASVGESICTALRHGSRDYELIVTNTSRPPLAAVRAEHYELLPPASAPDYLASLQVVAAAHDCDFLVPGSEVELARISRGRESLGGLRTTPLINSAEVIALCLDKARTAEFLVEKGFRTPVSLLPPPDRPVGDLPFALPGVIKPAVGGAGSAFVFIAQTPEEVEFFVGFLARHGYPPLIQEYVGNADQEYTVGVLHDPGGQLIGTSVMRRDVYSGLSRRLVVRNLTPRQELGPRLAVSSGISQGALVRHQPIRERCEEIAARLHSRGPLNIQGRWDGAEFVPFEINPRFSGTASMRALAGFNEPELLIEWHLASRRNPSRVEPKTGAFTRSLVEHFVPGD